MSLISQLDIYSITNAQLEMHYWISPKCKEKECVRFFKDDFEVDFFDSETQDRSRITEFANKATKAVMNNLSEFELSFSIQD